MSNSVHMQALRELTPTLVPFPEVIEECKGVSFHAMECGTSIAFALLQQPEISVARWFNSSGTQFPTHSHQQREWLIVYSGSMFLAIDGEEEKRLLPGQSVTIEPGVLHQSRFLEDTWYLAITIPQSPEWPTPES